ncbi:MAG: ABC transporter permease [Candidatus Nanopelagicales bacterium]
MSTLDLRDDVATLEAGLDALDTPTTTRESLGRKLRRTALPPVVAIVFFVLVWLLVVRLHVKPTYVIPPPSDVWSTFFDYWQQGLVQQAVWNSLRRAFVGFAASVVVGTVLGLLLAQSRFIRTAIGPLVTGLQSLPSVAWVPAAIIWFGLTDAAIYMVVLLGAVPSIANGLLAGVAQVPPLYLRVGRVLGARGWSAIRWVVLPAAMPGYLAGLRQGWAFAWRSLMAAELITFAPELGVSLGQILQTGRELSDMSLVVAAILMILVVGIGIELLVFAPLERRLLRSRGLTTATG